MTGESFCFKDDLHYWFYNRGFDQVRRENTGYIFFNTTDVPFFQSRESGINRLKLNVFTA